MATSNTQKKRAIADDSSLSASNGWKSSPASSSGGDSQWTYEVFLSFRGEDTRNNFTDHLYAALNQKGIYTFRDDERLERGQEISSELFEAIEISKVSIIIFSKNYASSKWCLNELAKIVECMEAKGQTVLPVFYKVDPSDVTKQSGDFKTAFDQHEQDFRDNLEQVERWKLALTKVGELAGWHLHDSSEVKLITDIVDAIWKRLNQIQHLPSIDEGFVGIHSRVEEINELLKPNIVDEIRFFGICGMGGIGKTTIARVVYEKLSDKYEGSCFLANIREVSEKKGLESLQEMLLYEVLKEKDLNISDYHTGIILIKKRLYRKKILLVLDDVNQLEQLERLVGRKDWFGFGSRIIITTRDEHLLKSHGINNIYKVKGLDDDEAHRLFCLKAFKCMGPTNDHVELSKHVVSYANGLPLALEVLGSFLCGRNVNEWKSVLERLKVDPNPKIVKTLRISYDGLEKREKQIFLDIACFFKGGDIDQIKGILDRCDFHPDIGIPILVERSLITIEGNKLQMHDMVQEMGQEVVREQHPTEPGKWSKLWLCQDVHRVLARNMGTLAVEAMIIVDYKMDITHANGECFSNMSNLRLLDINKVHISKGLEYLSNELRFLKWKGYRSKTLPSSFNPKKLFQLSLCSSHIEYLWNDIKPFKELTIIELSYSQNLVKTPDFTMIPNLERLDLQYCTRLLEVHESVGFLERLVILNLKNCENLVQFPSNVCGLKSLKILNLHGCSKLDRLPLNLEEMEHLQELHVAGTAIRQLPHNVCGLKYLKILNLCGCSKVDRLPLNLEEIEHLEELDVGRTAIRQVPSSIVQLTNLRTLSFGGCKGGPVETCCTSLFSLLLPTRKPDCMGLLLPPLAGLFALTSLDLDDCNLLEGAIPRDFGCLYSLKELSLGGNNFVSLPDSICQLSKLDSLWLEECHELQSLPKLPPELKFVGARDCTSLKTISSVLELTSPNIELHFFNCFNLVETRGRDNNNLAVLMLKHWLQRNITSNRGPFLRKVSPGPGLCILLPGSEISEFFNYQINEGSEVNGKLPDDWLNDEPIGFAACAVFSPCAHSDCVKIGRDIMTTAGDFDSPFSAVKSDHLWLGYLSCKQFYYRAPSEAVQVCFRTYCETPVVKRYGIRPLYKHDVKYLEDLSATDSGLPLVGILGIPTRMPSANPIDLGKSIEVFRLEFCFGAPDDDSEMRHQEIRENTWLCMELFGLRKQFVFSQKRNYPGQWQQHLSVKDLLMQG